MSSFLSTAADERVFPFYTSIFSFLAIITWKPLQRYITSKKGSLIRYGLSDTQLSTRRTIQICCAVASVAQVIIAAILFTKCRDFIHLSLLLSLVRILLFWCITAEDQSIAIRRFSSNSVKLQKANDHGLLQIPRVFCSARWIRGLHLPRSRSNRYRETSARSRQ